MGSECIDCSLYLSAWSVINNKLQERSWIIDRLSGLLPATWTTALTSSGLRLHDVSSRFSDCLLNFAAGFSIRSISVFLLYRYCLATRDSAYRSAYRENPANTWYRFAAD